MARAVQPILEEQLGQPVAVTNMPGAAGAVAAQYVLNQPANGYTTLMSAENTALYRVLGLSDVSFEDFEPVMLFNQVVAALSVRADSPFKTMADLVEYARKNPGRLKSGATGPGGISFVVENMLGKAVGVRFTSVPFDGENSALVALLGEHVDFTIATLIAAVEHYRAKKTRLLAVFAPERLAALPDVPAVVEHVQEMGKFLPWGPFYGLWVKKGTPSGIVERLRAASRVAAQDPSFRDFNNRMLGIPLALEGEPARSFVRRWESITTWILYDAGASKVSPAQFGIPRL